MTRSGQVWRESYVQAGETRFFVRVYAPEPPADAAQPPTPPTDGDEGDERDRLVLLLHGWPQDGSCWAAVAPTIAAAGYRVVCPDLKGFGRSDAPRRGYDPATLADEISQLIQALGATKAVLVGHDWGGALALATAFRHPGRVRAVVVASSPFRELDLLAAWHVPLFNLPLLPQLAFRLAGAPLTRAAIRYAAKVQDPYTDETLARYTAAVRASPSAWLAYYRRMSRSVVLDAGIRHLRERTPWVAAPRGPHRLRVPATVVWGEGDPVTPLHLGEQVAADLRAPLVVIPGVGHFVHEEAPDAVAAAVLDLLESDAPREAGRAG